MTRSLQFCGRAVALASFMACSVCCATCAAYGASAGSDEVPLDSDAQRLATALKAQKAFDEGMSLVATDPTRAQERFRESVNDYQRLVDCGIRNGELFINLANSLVQSDERGRAIGALLDATQLLPGDPRVIANLAHARSLVPARGGALARGHWSDPLASIWHESGWASSAVRFATTASLWTLLWTIIAIGIAARWTALKPWRATIACALALFAVAAATLVIDFVRERVDPAGVVLHGDVIARKGNGSGFSPAFTEPLDEGTEFTLIEHRPGWCHIQLADGQSGWIPSGDAYVAGPHTVNSP